MKTFKIASLFFLSFILLTLSSCQNEPLDGDFSFETDGEIDTPTGGGSSGDDGSGSPGGSSTGDYWPMAIDNSWNYEFVIDDVQQDDYAMTIDANVEYQSNSVFRFSEYLPTTTGTDGTEFEGLSITTYARKNGGDYIVTAGDLEADYLDGLFSLTQTGYSYIVLKDYLEVGGTWSSTAQVVTEYTSLDPTFPDLPSIVQNFEFDMEILEKGISLVVNGQTYNDVIKVKQVLNSSTPDFPDQIITSESNYYFALDVGLIKSVSNSLDVADNIQSTSTTELIDYTLN